MPHPTNKDTSGPGHRFGGNWTDTKLELLERYLHGYTTALQNKPFRIAYIDTFAGTGYRTLSREDRPEELLFPDLAEAEPQELLDGSARIALKTTPRFHKYIFIEKSKQRCEQLQQLKAQFPDLSQDIIIKKAEANSYIRELCAKDWSDRRAVMFLDPYGMQVEWGTIEAIASTRAIDLWILFPLGIGVNRLLTRSGDIPEGWKRKLDSILGTPEWAEAFYRVEPAHPTLFEPEAPKLVKTANFDAIGRFFNDRLKTIFAGVAPDPRPLFNSSGCPLYLFCFAVGNPRGVNVALRIANHILKKVT